jgi:2-oxoglutarate dehydrogenase E2 component (dihydrolipoamide succinyltransferase)
VAKEGDTVEPGTKIAVISKSGEVVTEAPSEKAAAHPPPPEEKESAEKQIPKAETAPIKEKIKEPSPSQPKAKGPSPPPKHTASEPQLPPKDRERRVSFRVSSSWKKIRLCIFIMYFPPMVSKY